MGYLELPRGSKDVLFRSGGIGNGKTRDLYFFTRDVGYHTSEFVSYNQQGKAANDRYFQLRYRAHTGGLIIVKVATPALEQ